MAREVDSVLDELERTHGCRILYAVESGSRAWGFASPDSDFDIRFIYVHPTPWYLELEEKRDTLEGMFPGELDCSGWELRKTLRLFAGCNLSLYEWLGSPIVYRAEAAFHDALHMQIPAYFNARKGVHHYLSTARRVREGHLQGDGINIKKFFYIVRPLLAAHWISERETMPPTPFADLMEAGLAPSDVLDAIRAVQEAKRSAAEGDRITMPPAVGDWIGASFDELEERAPSLPVAPQRDWAPLNQLFRAWVD